MMGAVGLGDDQQAGGILVDPVDDTGPLFAADARQAVARVMQKRIDQRPRGRARRGVDDHPRGLVDDDQLAILIDDGQGDVLGPRLHLRGSRDGDLIDLALGHAGLGVGGRGAVAPHRAPGDQPRDARA